MVDHLTGVLQKNPQQMRADGASSIEDYLDDAKLPEQAQTIKREIDMIAKWYRTQRSATAPQTASKKAGDSGAAFVTDRDEKGEPKAPIKLEVPRVAAKKTAQEPAPPAPVPEAAAPPAPIPRNGTFDINTLSTEALTKSIKALASVKEFETDKSGEALVEAMAAVLKTRPVEVEPPKAPAAPAAAAPASMPMAASSKKAIEDPTRAPVSLGGLEVAASEKTAEDYRLHDYKLDDEGIRPSGKLPSMDEQESGMSLPEEDEVMGMEASVGKEAVSPEGWGGTVEHMKEHKNDIDNPFALAWYMKNKGDKPHYKDSSDEDSVAKRMAALTVWKERQASMYRELAGKYASGAAGGAWSTDIGEKGKVVEDGGRTPEVGEAHGKIDEAPAKLGRPATTPPIKLAAEMTVNKAVKQSEEMGKRLKEMYLEAKSLTQVNDQRAVREAVEGIFRAADAFDEAIKLFSKQQQQEENEAAAAEIKAKNKKSSLLGLAVAGAE